MDKPVNLVNNTGIDLRDFEAEIRAALATTGQLPEELSDVLKLRTVVTDSETRFVLEVL